MNGPPRIATCSGSAPFADAGAAGALERLVPGTGPWEVELGFGKGRFLLARAASHPDRRFLGIELAGEYFRLVASRLARRRLANVLLIHGEALALLATALPPRFADALHVYFPDPWPKTRHVRRRLLSPATVDLLFGALAPGGRLQFATDHPAYGAFVERLLNGAPGARVERVEPGWPEGPRTNYEAKYVAEGRSIVRLEASQEGAAGIHPAGVSRLAIACGEEIGEEDELAPPDRERSPRSSRSAEHASGARSAGGR